MNSHLKLVSSPKKTAFIRGLCRKVYFDRLSSNLRPSSAPLPDRMVDTMINVLDSLNLVSFLHNNLNNERQDGDEEEDKLLAAES